MYKMGEQFRRKSSEEILESISKVNKGRLKIILGTVSGSGKTFQLLLEGNDLKKRSIDVVIGLASASNHPKTIEQIGQLEMIPPIHWNDHGTLRQDLNMEAIVERNPEVVLVDELSQRNRPESRNKTRLNDVLELIEKKISVITTINIYELQGVKQMAEKQLGVRVHVNHCVPENTLDLADEVRLLDVPPNVILSRLQESEQNQDTIEENGKEAFFRRDNLAILRELALRIVAEEVNGALDDYREKLGILGASGATEKILVTVQYHWNGSTLIRRGQQIAKRLGGDLLVVCFRSAKKSLTKNEATYRRSIKKLVEKIGGEFEELLLTTDIAVEIESYTTKKNISRIVMGQSKRSRWEEIIYGSIINKILRKTHNIDIFIIADRAEKEGVRVLPANKAHQEQSNSYRRLSNKEIEKKIHKIKSGTLKVYIGSAPGVGKTYTMLREANVIKKNGIDVVIGLLETHGRKDTLEQVGSLEIVPKKKVHYKNVIMEEMDTNAIINRNPEVVLVDELAHTNIPTSKYIKRYQDVEEILKAGISVISTMNIQHLESLNDHVYQVTGVRVRETVPDHILRGADEIELIDISAKALRQRMREGNIYAMTKVEQSLKNFFKTGNLIALRELALREVADDVDDRLESFERKRSLRGPWRMEEVIFVCVNLRHDSESLIRRGFRIAYRLKASWYVCFVKDHSPLTAEEEHMLQKVISLTDRLGGTFEMYEASNQRKVVAELVEQLNEKNATQVIVGQSARTRWEEIMKGSVVHKLLRLVRHLDVLVVADQKQEK